MSFQNTVPVSLIETDQGFGNVSIFDVVLSTTDALSDRGLWIGYAASRGTERTIDGTPMLNGVPADSYGTGVLVDGGRAVSINWMFWEDASLPAAAGTYQLAVNLSGGHGADPRMVFGYEFSNVNQTTPLGTEVTDSAQDVVMVVDTPEVLSATSTHVAGNGLIAFAVALEGAEGVSVTNQSSLTNEIALAATNANQLIGVAGYKVAGSTSEAIQFDVTDSDSPGDEVDSMAMLVIPIQFNAGAAVTITDVNDDDVFHLNQSNTITVSDATGMTTSTPVTVNGTSVTVTDVNTTTNVLTVTGGLTVGAVPGTSVNVVVDGGTAFSATLDEQEAWEDILVSGFNPTTKYNIPGYTEKDNDICVRQITPYQPAGSVGPDLMPKSSVGSPVEEQFYFLDSGNSYAATAVGTILVPATAPPVLPADQSVSVLEGNTPVGNSSTASSGASPIVYTITGGADQADFSIDGSTGALTFLSAPDYESQIQHVVEVTGINEYGSDNQTVTVDITNVLEQTITPPADSGKSYPFGSGGVAQDDADFVAWLATASSTGSGIASNSTSLTYPLTGVTVVTFTADDATADTATYTATEAANQAPAGSVSTMRFTIGGNFTRTLNYATDPEGQPLTYTEVTLPAGWNVVNNEIVGVDPGSVQTYSNNQLNASDGTDNTDSNLFAIEVVEPTESSSAITIKAPVVSCIHSPIKSAVGH